MRHDVSIVSSNLQLPLPPEVLKLLFIRKPRARTRLINAVAFFCILVQCTDCCIFSESREPVQIRDRRAPTQVVKAMITRFVQRHGCQRRNYNSTRRNMSNQDSANQRFRICRLQLHCFGTSRRSANLGALSVCRSESDRMN